LLNFSYGHHHALGARGLNPILAGRYPRPIADTDEWIHPSIQETLRIAGMFSIDEYVH
jgi:hypothetical protein